MQPKTSMKYHTMRQKEWRCNLRKLLPIFHLNYILAAIVHAFANGDQLRIREIRDRSGDLQWRAYDSRTDKTYVFVSIDEVYVWLEERNRKEGDRNSQIW